MNVEMRGINKSFATNQVLKDAGFFLKDGEIHALMDGQEVCFKSPQEAEKAGIVFIYQELNVLFDLTVEQNLFMGKEITKGRLQPFIATLITMTAYRGLAMLLTDGKPISRLAESIGSEGGSFFFKAMGKGNLAFAGNTSVSFPIPALILILVFVIFYFILNRTTFGRRIYATGSNAKCAKLVGVSTDKVKIIVYCISGFLSALAGLIMISRVNSAPPTLGDGYELDAIAAVALGAVEAVSGAGKDILVVGFDATDDAIDAIQAGRMAATIAQQPALIGSTAVENAVKLINGESIPNSIPVEVTLITIENA